eukprot:gb/GECG01011303.1/.p1 GENE.gb/GECG01011303.1/~~gb/GECG01011303.1/.p1  ORF type:complete len:344 (+),score=46.17 gb/GECG01011303.1/:1-1032(+)
MKDVTKLVVIGAGRIGKWHIEHLTTRIVGVEVVGVVDISDKAAKEATIRFDIPHFSTNLEEILDETLPDAIVIASSTDTHEEAIRSAARRGVDVFCEKPLSNNIESANRIKDMVKEHGIRLQVGFNRRFDRSFSRVEAAIREGEIGELHSLRIISRDPSPPPIEYVKRSGGLFVDMTIHDFDMVRFLTKAEPTEVFAMGSCKVDPEIGAVGDVDTALVMMKFENGMLATVENSRKATYGYDQRVEAFGADGSIATDNMFPNTATVSTANGVSRDLPMRFFKERYEDACICELQSFVNTVKKRTKPLVDEVDGTEALMLADAAQLSLKQGSPVKLNELRYSFGT